MNRLRPLMILTASLLLMASCASNPIQMGNIWVEPDFADGGFSDIMVIGMSRNPDTEKIFERTLANQLAAEGVMATPRFKVMAPGEIDDKQAILAAIEGENFDAVLITRLMRVDSQWEFTPGMAYAQPAGWYGSYWNYYQNSYTMMVEPATLRQSFVATLESNLYRVADEQLIWTAQSRTTTPEDVIGNIEALSLKVTEELKSKGLLAGAE